MRFEITHDPEAFATRAEAFLAARIERTVLATVLLNVRSGHYVSGRPTFAVGVDAEGEMRSAALRTPPWPMLATEIVDADADELLSVWLAEDPAPPGVSGQPPTARAIAAAWAARTGGHARCSMREAMHVLQAVSEPPRPASGQLRAAHPGERQLLADWLRGFARDTGVLGGGSQAEQIVDAQLAAGRLFVWDDNGPTSLVSLSPRVAGVTRLGPVYTPPELRRRGYASTAVAAASRQALASGAERCALFTDLANPTSNKIYAEVGYRRIADWEEHTFQA